MNRKLIGIFVMALLIGTVLPATGSIEKNSYMTEKNEPLVFLEPKTDEETQYIIVEPDTESNLPKGTVLTQDNLVTNPSFEEGDTLPTGWVYSDTQSFHVTHIWDSSEAHSGDKSVGISMARYSNYGPYEPWITTDYIPVDFSNNTYELSSWVKFPKEPSKDQYVWVGIRLFDANKDKIAGGMSFGFFYTIPQIGNTLEWIPNG